MIECKNITVTRHGKTILHSVSCDIPMQKFTAIIGKNGSGKTTLANCICNQTRYTGNILIDAVDISTVSSNALSEKLAYLPQDLPVPAVTVEELVSFGRMPYLGLQKKLTADDRKAICDAISKTQMQPFSLRRISSLSGGERQKAHLARILAQETEILVLDEPTASMDAASQLQFLMLLKELSNNGKTVVAILHDLSLVAALADHIIIMDSGECVFSDSTDTCLSLQKIERIFNVRRYTIQNNSKSEIFFR